MLVDRRSEARRGHGVATWLAWWAALLAIWVVLVDTVRVDELIAGAVAAAVAASIALAVHRLGYIQFAPRAAWLRETPAIAWNVLVDCGLLGAALWRRVVHRRRIHGVMLRMPFHYGDDNGRDGARRALVNYAVSLTPNTYVVDIDPDSDSILVHRLVLGPVDRVLRLEEQRAVEMAAASEEGENA